jgi:hypothetical protein
MAGGVVPTIKAAHIGAGIQEPRLDPAVGQTRHIAAPVDGDRLPKIRRGSAQQGGTSDPERDEPSRKPFRL